MANKKKDQVGTQPTNEEQMKRRQSSAKPTAEQELQRQMGQQQMAGQQNPMQMPQNGPQNSQNGTLNSPMINSMPAQQNSFNGAVDGFAELEQPIGREAVHKATLTLQKYKEGKANLERRIVENEQWYKLRHWECMRGPHTQVEPTSGWLFNCIMNKHADAMDNYPSPNILPREESDKGEAEMLTSIIPVILDQNDFEQTYSDVWSYKLKTGTGVYGVFWDSSKLNGLGDIAIKKVDLINLFWEPGIMDIQRSKNFFHVELADNDTLVQQYPQLQNKLSSATIDVAKYVYDDTVDTSEKSVIVDWYYKKVNSTGKQVLHYCKFVNDVVLFATENDPQYSETGFYDHAKYPFVFDVLFQNEGTPAGFGYIDIGKSSQEYIDRGNKAIMENMLANAKPRHFIRTDGSVNEEEYADQTKDFVHVDGNLGQDSIMPISGKPLSSIYVEVINNKIDELKQTTGNQDVSNGGTTSGVTAASAIAAMQEAGSKLSRDANKSAYRSFRQIVLLCIELIRQFYDMPRCFRIMGANGAARYVQYSNAGIQAQYQGMDWGIDMGVRVPQFDVEVEAQKQSPYTKMSQNELALQFYSAGFFNPQMAQQALMCLDMMDFDRKDIVMQKIEQNAMMMQQAMMMQAAAPEAQPSGSTEDVSTSGDESSVTADARERVANSTSPT